MKHYCPHCHALVSASDIHLDRMVAKCVRCDHVFAIETPAGETPARRRPRIVKPKSITVRPEHRPADAPSGYTMRSAPSEFTITRRWFAASAWFMVLFCVVWDAFMVNWYSIVLSHPDKTGVHMGIWFPLIHVAVGVWLTYSTLATFINTTMIAVRSGMLTVRHGPLPWWGHCDVAVKDIKQLYCGQQVVRRRGGSGSTYALNALLTNGEKRVLVKSLSIGDEALFLEQEIEARLGIADGFVLGEYVEG